MQFSEILNLVLGGGFVALLIAVVTLRATVRKANAEAEKAKAEAETVRIDNAEHATRVLIDDILKPLREELGSVRSELAQTKEELNATRKEFGSTKREMARLRKAIDAANRCEHHDECPVLYKLRELPKRSKDDDGAVGEDRPPPTLARADVGESDGDAGGHDGAASDTGVG
ncbi:MAG: hypothetical protein J6R90_04925 [Alistipes sp.]|nr:hypothetical protein [Alistipes sp.]